LLLPLFKDSDPFEKLHIKFIKEILGIHCKASNDGCRAELNRTHLKSKILDPYCRHSGNSWVFENHICLHFEFANIDRVFYFMNHIISSKNTLVYDIYIKSREINPWVKKVKNLLNGLAFLHHR
jgi:hypothetical protein